MLCGHSVENLYTHTTPPPGRSTLATSTQSSIVRMNLFAIPYPLIDPVLIEIGPVAIRWYALAYIAGIVGGWWYAARLVTNSRLWTSASPPLMRDQLEDMIIWITLGVILGGRLGYVLFYQAGYYLSNPAEIIAVWQGGMSFHGGLLGVVLALVLFCWKKGLPLLSVTDIVAAVAPIGLFFGRIANFINGELYGRPTDVQWAMVFPTDPHQLPRHPSQLYEALLEGLLLFLVLRILTHHTPALRRPGLCAGVFLVGYGVARVVVEFFREPDEFLGYFAGVFTMGMFLSAPMILGGLVLIANAFRTDAQAGQHSAGRSR